MANICNPRTDCKVTFLWLEKDKTYQLYHKVECVMYFMLFLYKRWFVKDGHLIHCTKMFTWSYKLCKY